METDFSSINKKEQKNSNCFKKDKKRHTWHLQNCYSNLFSSSNLTENTKDERDRLTGSNLLNRYRAISSPTLHNSNIENGQLNNQQKSNDCPPYTTTITVNDDDNSNTSHPNHNNGVFYKFRKTFEHFKQCPSATISTSSNLSNKIINNIQKSNNDNIVEKNYQKIGSTTLEDKTNIVQPIIITTSSTTETPIVSTTNLSNSDTNKSNSGRGSFKNRFGASIWRNSKERRKTKFNRRDKCNSGDSGIQIEGENEENLYENICDNNDFEHDGISKSINIRRSNSDKSPKNSTLQDHCNIIVTSESFRTNNNKRLNMNCNNPQSGSTSAKTKALKKVQNCENGTSRTSPKPKRSFSHPSLDQMAKYADDSDTDSISSHQDEKQTIFAEVLNPFTPAGPQELSLEPGALVEIIRQDDGPWWYGRIKHDEIIEKILEPQQGWFPKDFVRVLNPFLTKSEPNAIDSTASTATTVTSQHPNNMTKTTTNIVVDNNCTTIDTNCDNRNNSENQITNIHVDTTTTSSSSSAAVTIKSSSPCTIKTTVELSLNSANNTNNTLNNSLNTSHLDKQGCQNNQDTQSITTANIISSQQMLNTTNDVATYTTTNSVEIATGSTVNFNIQQTTFTFNSNENLRQNAVKELLETEINYVNLLGTLCLGYLKEMQKRIDIFSPESLKIIFSNIESVWEFQKNFLEALKKGVESNSIAKTFINHQNGFTVYSTYCNSYPRALMELESYSSSKEAKCIFENIRVAQNLSHLPLSAHLLAPIQRICRYPLHLAELVKHTPTKTELDNYTKSITSIEISSNGHHTTTTTDEIDNQSQSQLSSNHEQQSQISQLNFCDNKENFELALNVMKKVTENVNEGKRHSENLNRFQASFENFQGPPIACHSTRFFLQTDATRISPNLWNNTYTLFLFDNQIIYCKKDILKRNHFIYKGRIFLDNCRILNLPDGKIFGVSLKNALRIYCETLNKWFDFCFRSSSRKLRFLSTLAIERQFCGKNLFVSELTGNGSIEQNDDDNLSDREYHSDYCDNTTPVTHISESNLNSLNWKQNIYNKHGSCSSGGNLCDINKDHDIMIEKYYETLPKKSKKFKKHSAFSTSNSFGLNYNNQNYNSHFINHKNSQSSEPNFSRTNSQSSNSCVSQTSTTTASNGSAGRRKLGNWFRKSKSTNTTPNQSPTHLPSAVSSTNPLNITSSDSSNNLVILHQTTKSSSALDGGLMQETCNSIN